MSVHPGTTPQAAGAALGGAQTIHVVQGMTGEYSDRTEWNVCAFWSEDDAKAYVEFLTAKRQELPPRDYDWDAQQLIEKVMRAFDPEFSEDYTGTRWHVASVPLCAARSEGQ